MRSVSLRATTAPASRTRAASLADAGLGVGGLLAGCLTVVTGARTLAATSVPPTTWFGLQPQRGYRPGDSALAGAGLLLGLLALVALWALLVRRQLRRPMSRRALAGLIAAWQTPFVLGPPLVSKDVWAYLAQGQLLRHHLDPYSSGIEALGFDAVRIEKLGGVSHAGIVRAVDPTWRSVTSPYGPVASLLERTVAAVSGERPILGVLLLRLVVVACVALTAWACSRLVPSHRSIATAMVAANPLVLVHAVSGVHLDMIMVGLVALALVAAQRNLLLVAVALCCVAGSVKAPAFAAVPALLLWEATRPPSRGRVRRPAWPIAAGVVTGLATTGACALLVPDGFGWLRGLNTPGLGHRPTSPAALLTSAFRTITPTGIADGVRTGVHAAVLTVAAVVVLLLAITVRRRPLRTTAGWSLLAVAFAGPALYPWYLLWGVLFLPVDTRRRRVTVQAVCGGYALLAITGLPRAATASVDALVVAMVAVAVALTWRRFDSGESVDPPAIAPAAEHKNEHADAGQDFDVQRHEHPVAESDR